MACLNNLALRQHLNLGVVNRFIKEMFHKPSPEPNFIFCRSNVSVSIPVPLGNWTIHQTY